MNNIILIGFMGTGKTTIGRILADMLNYTFYDSDEEIEKKAGYSIKDIFSSHGESYFRELESSVISKLASLSNSVIATGGGAVLSQKNMDVLRASGTIICLKTTPEIICKRTQKTNTRPLLNTENQLEAIESILEIRTGLYNGDLNLDTSNFEPTIAAARIKAYISSVKQESCFNMEFGSTYCKVVSGSHILEGIPEYICPFYPEGKILIVSNPTIYELWGSKLSTVLSGSYQIEWCLVTDGEEYKNMDSLTQIYDKAVQMRLSRDNLIIGFGGGVIGDMAGFAAATYMRGIPYIQVPTTLLAQADSSIGGKTAINHREAKNLIGSFYQPRMILADTSLLLTLSPREINSGLAEVIKYGIICDYAFFEYLEHNIENIQNMNHKALAYIVQISCRTKAAVAQQDEKDYGTRMLLNYGHTIGHAIEASTGYSSYRHGEAISIGMEGAAMIAAALGIMKESEHIRQGRLLAKAGLPTRFPGMDVEKVLYLMKNDKKSQNGRLRLILPRALGSASVFDDIPTENILYALEQLTSLEK